MIILMNKYGPLVVVLAACVCVAHASACTLQHDPVCGSDGKTYSNNCFLALKMAKNPQLQLKYKGQCEKHNRKTRSVVCSIDITVCGSDGITYRNPCVLNHASNLTNKLELLHLGACNKNSTDKIDHDSFPQFGKDNNVQSLLRKTQDKPESKNVNHTKGNEQDRPFVENKNSSKHVPNENPSIKLSCPCGLELEDICGKDGVTDDNPCLLKCVATLNNILEIQFEGKCNGSELNVVETTSKREKRSNQKTNDDEDELHCACGRNYLAVCGTNGVSYDNACLLACAAKKNKSLEIKSIGRCDGRKEYSEDYDVFRSENIAELVRILQTKTQINKETNEDGGAELSCPCARNLWELCGTDGVTYDNECLFECAQKINSNLRIQFEGRCDGKDMFGHDVKSHKDVTATKANLIENVKNFKYNDVKHYTYL